MVPVGLSKLILRFHNRPAGWIIALFCVEEDLTCVNTTGCILRIMGMDGLQHSWAESQTSAAVRASFQVGNQEGEVLLAREQDS